MFRVHISSLLKTTKVPEGYARHELKSALIRAEQRSTLKVQIDLASRLSYRKLNKDVLFPNLYRPAFRT